MKINDKAVELLIGTKVFSALYGGRFGYVFNVHPYTNPSEIKSIANIMQSGGSADYDIVFENGTISHKVPECIIRGVQWELYDDRIGIKNINDLLENAKIIKIESEAKKVKAKDDFRNEVEKMKLSGDFVNLVQGDCSSGTLAAKNIRKLLKAKLPGVKFSVRKRYYGSLVVSADELSTEQKSEVREVISLFKTGYYDVHEDIHKSSLSPFQAVFGGVDYISLY